LRTGVRAVACLTGWPALMPGVFRMH
jgi:hypothetical protein